MEYVIVTDNEGHRYVIPENKRHDWYEWLESSEYGYDDGKKYAEYIDGGDVVFKDWRIG